MYSLTLLEHCGHYYRVRLKRANYSTNGNLCLVLECFGTEFDMWEPFGNVTVNITDASLPTDYGYVDINNLPGAIHWIAENNLGTFTGLYTSTGYVSYPLYKFNLERIDLLIELNKND